MFQFLRPQTHRGPGPSGWSRLKFPRGIHAALVLQHPRRELDIMRQPAPGFVGQGLLIPAGTDDGWGEAAQGWFGKKSGPPTRLDTSWRARLAPGTDRTQVTFLLGRSCPAFAQNAYGLLARRVRAPGSERGGPAYARRQTERRTAHDLLHHGGGSQMIGPGRSARNPRPSRYSFAGHCPCAWLRTASPQSPNGAGLVTASPGGSTAAAHRPKRHLYARQPPPVLSRLKTLNPRGEMEKPA
jgi:hypothetical protein